MAPKKAKVELILGVESESRVRRNRKPVVRYGKLVDEASKYLEDDEDDEENDVHSKKKDIEAYEEQEMDVDEQEADENDEELEEEKSDLDEKDDDDNILEDFTPAKKQRKSTGSSSSKSPASKSPKKVRSTNSKNRRPIGKYMKPKVYNFYRRHWMSDTAYQLPSKEVFPTIADFSVPKGLTNNLRTAFTRALPLSQWLPARGLHDNNFIDLTLQNADHSIGSAAGSAGAGYETISIKCFEANTFPSSSYSTTTVGEDVSSSRSYDLYFNATGPVSSVALVDNKRNRGEGEEEEEEGLYAIVGTTRIGYPIPPTPTTAAGSSTPAATSMMDLEEDEEETKAATPSTTGAMMIYDYELFSSRLQRQQPQQQAHQQRQDHRLDPSPCAYGCGNDYIRYANDRDYHDNLLQVWYIPPAGQVAGQEVARLAYLVVRSRECQADCCQ